MTISSQAWTGFACALRSTALSGALIAVGAPGAWAQDFDLDALVEAAKKEGPITVYASTGKVKKAAEAFTQKYGIEATGTKIKGAAQIELVVREAQAGNIVGDVILSADAGATLAQVLPTGIAASWTPPDMTDTIPEDSRDPLVVWRDPAVWAYNNEDGGECPVGNVWELTEDEWNRRVTMEDPLNKPAAVDWFNQMETNSDQAMADAYEAHFGEKLDTSDQSATALWVQGMAENGPLLTTSSSDAAEAIGTPGQEDPFFGIVSSAKFRDVGDGGLTMAICEGIEPFVGRVTPAYGLIAEGSENKNAAKLFLHFMMTSEGVEPMTRDGKMSGNTAVPAHPEEKSGVVALRDQLTPHLAATGAEDFDTRQDWQDFWRLHYSR